MKITVSVDEFKNGVNKISKIASKHLSLPILSCILIKAEDDIVHLSATNLDLGVLVSIPAKVEKKGTVAVQADIISNIISQIQNEPKIDIFTNENGNLVLKSKLFEGTLNTMSHDDFPLIPLINDPLGILEVKVNNFIDLCKSVVYSGSVSSIKPELSSILFYIDDNDNLTAVATDLFRLAEKKVSITKQKNFDKTLISIKNILEIIRILGDSKNTLEISIKDNQITFKIQDIYIISRTIDSNFPDYKQIIPTEYKTEVILIKNDLLNTLKVSKIFTDKLQHLKFSISPKDKIFTVSLKNSEIGESISHIPAKIEGEALTISFNFRYIADVLNSVNHDSVRLEFNGVGKSVVVKGVGDSSFLYLVMPLIIKNE